VNSVRHTGQFNGMETCLKNAIVICFHVSKEHISFIKLNCIKSRYESSCSYLVDSHSKQRNDNHETASTCPSYASDDHFTHSSRIFSEQVTHENEQH
jgi:hypothetical protein